MRHKPLSRALAVLSCMVISVGLALPVQAGDNPPDPEDVGDHSTVACANGEHVRDDEIAETIRENLPEDDDGIHCKDVKIFVQCCHGGGLLDDIHRVLSPPNTPPGGVPWVGGSAANPQEYSWGPNDAWCDANPPTGDYWTDTLTPNMGGGTVQGSCDAAAAGDPAAAGGSANTQYGIEEHPMSNSGNGGSNVTWGEGDPNTDHEVVVFSGDTETRHQNDCDNFESACNNMWGANANVNKNTGGTKAQFLAALAAAAANCDDNTQLVVYISGHGDRDLDVVEFLNDLFGNPEDDPVTVDPLVGQTFDAPLGPEWTEGFTISAAQGETPEPYLTLTTGDVLDSSLWELTFNGILLPFTGTGTYLPGETIDIDLSAAQFEPTGANTITLTPLGPADPIVLENMELCSGGRNNGMTFPIVEGDLDGDLFVGQADLDIVLDNWGESIPPGNPAADPSEDFFVGQADLDIVLDDWGLHSPPPPYPDMGAGAGGGETLSSDQSLQPDEQSETTPREDRVARRAARRAARAAKKAARRAK